MLEALKELILSDFFDNELIQSHVKSAQNAVERGEITSFDAADQIYNQFKNKQK
jgi:hypothetical protein